MEFEHEKLLIDKSGNVVTMRNVITIRNRDNGMETQTIQVYENERKYLPADLSPLTEEQYQEYIKHDEDEESI